ncbi:MAG TPA: TolC family protein [Kofleriaceae bacterium]|nr:TolC family protein [Kofleriaceae bacterium]
MARSLDLEEQRLLVTAAGHEIAAGRLGWLPHLGLGAAAAREDHAWEVGPAASLSIPLFDNGQATRAAGRAHLSAAQARLADRSLAVRRAARMLAARVTAAHARAARLEHTLLPLRRRIVEQTVLQYNAMQLGPFELLLARQQEIDAERRAVEARRDFWLAAAEADALRAGRLSGAEAGRLPAATDSVPEANGGSHAP